MRNLLFLSLCILLAACKSTPKSTSFENSRIGIDYRLYETLQLCHTHVGLTVFQNTDEVYPINDNVNDLVISGYIEGIQSTNNIPIQVDSGVKWSKYLSYSSWDSSAKLNPEGLIELQKTQASHKLDYILIARDYKIFFKGNACHGAWFKSQMDEVKSFVPIYVALVFEAKSGDYIGSTFIPNNHHSAAYQNIGDFSKLEPNEVLQLVNYSRDAAANSAKMFFEKNGS